LPTMQRGDFCTKNKDLFNFLEIGYHRFGQKLHHINGNQS
jgi:hypothetical protein